MKGGPQKKCIFCMFGIEVIDNISIVASVLTTLWCLCVYLNRKNEYPAFYGVDCSMCIRRLGCDFNYDVGKFYAL